jgi:hypothetical protein
MLPHDYHYVAEIRRQEMVSMTHPPCNDGPLAVGRWPRLAFGRPSFDGLRTRLKLLSRSPRQPTARDSIAQQVAH